MQHLNQRYAIQQYLYKLYGDAEDIFRIMLPDSDNANFPFLPEKSTISSTLLGFVPYFFFLLKAKAKKRIE